MPDHSLAALTALGGDRPHRDSIEGLAITENPDLALASVAGRLGRDADLAGLAQGFFGFEMPAPGRMLEAPPWSAFWTGNAQWMIEAPFASHENIARIVKDALGDAVSVTEQTDAWARFDVSGKSAADMFERVCALEVRSMETGTANRTMIEHLGCFVLCRAAGETFSVLGPRSAARSLHHALVAAARSAA